MLLPLVYSRAPAKAIKVSISLGGSTDYRLYRPSIVLARLLGMRSTLKRAREGVETRSETDSTGLLDSIA